ncbi:MAG: hypothetical protein V4537_14320 [Pseudomonadota bacterium]
MRSISRFKEVDVVASRMDKTASHYVVTFDLSCGHQLVQRKNRTWRSARRSGDLGSLNQAEARRWMKVKRVMCPACGPA